MERKIALTAIITFFVLVLGTAYQYYYLEERTEYEHAIQLYSLKFHDHKLKPKKLRHLAILAIDRYGLTEAHRIEEDYRVLLEEAGR